MIFGGPTAPEAAFETRLVEEELALQLDLLREETPKPYLFPKIEEPMIELPHLKDGDTAAALKVQKGTQNAVLEEMVEEGVFDSLAICALLGAVMFVPQLLH